MIGGDADWLTLMHDDLNELLPTNIASLILLEIIKYSYGYRDEE